MCTPKQSKKAPAPSTSTGEADNSEDVSDSFLISLDDVLHNLFFFVEKGEVYVLFPRHRSLLAGLLPN